MKKFGKVIWRVYLVFMAILLLGFIATFLGTPWGYLDFYIRANRHLERWFDGDAKVAGVSYDFKMQRYLGSAKHEDLPGDTFALRDDHSSEDPVMYNYYHLLLWETELMAHYQPEYPEFTLHFDLPVNGSPYVSPRSADDYPSIFVLDDPGDFLTQITVTIPPAAVTERLFALVTELDAAFPQTSIGIWQGEDYVQLDWLDRGPRENYEQFSILLNDILI